MKLRAFEYVVAANEVPANSLENLTWYLYCYLVDLRSVIPFKKSINHAKKKRITNTMIINPKY